MTNDTVAREALASMAGASLTLLACGTAEAAMQSKSVDIHVAGDGDAQKLIIYMTSGGDVTHRTFDIAGTGDSYFTGGRSALGLTAGTILIGGPGIMGYANSFVGPNPPATGSANVPLRLSAGDMFGYTSASFVANTFWIAWGTGTNTMPASFWNYGTGLPTSGYIGFSLANPAVGGDSYFAWVALTVNGVSDFTVTGYGWEDQPLTATAAGSGSGGSAASGGMDAQASTPEPAASGLGLLALGATGLLRCRRRWRRQDAESPAGGTSGDPVV